MPLSILPEHRGLWQTGEPPLCDQKEDGENNNFPHKQLCKQLHRFQLLQDLFVRTTKLEWESYLIHTSISKEQRGVIQGDCRRRVHIGMLVFLEEVNKPLPDLASCERDFHLEAASHSSPKQKRKRQGLGAV